MQGAGVDERLNRATRLDFLDGVRALAILGVVAVHTGLSAGLSAYYLEAGARGVQLFFVISGFTMMYVQHHRKRPDTAIQFYVRRFFRIAPLYYGAMAWWFFQKPVPASVVGAHALFVHSWFPAAIHSFVPGGWSIGDEIAFYLLFPVIIWMVRGPLNALALLALSLVAASLWHTHVVVPAIAAPVQDPVLNYWLYYMPVYQFPAFCTGMLVYFLVDSSKSLGPRVRSFAGAAVSWPPLPYSDTG
jgi:peptidoglycan/LPS O-acetylase OafA/YrhL